MKFLFHHRYDPAPRVCNIAAAVTHGAGRYGDSVYPLNAVNGCELEIPNDLTGGIIFGIAGEARLIFDRYRAIGKDVILIDKGYGRGQWWRVSINSNQPLDYFQNEPRSWDRFRNQSMRTLPDGFASLQPYKKSGDCILFDGASQKYLHWHKLGDWAEWGQAMLAKIREHTDWPIIYRPRPSHNQPPMPTGFKRVLPSAGPTLSDDMGRACLVVSHGGNIGWDAVVSGVPHFAIDESIARPLSETDWSRIQILRKPSEVERLQWCADVAYCQFTVAEFADGTAWEEIRRVISDGSWQEGRTSTTSHST